LVDRQKRYPFPIKNQTNNQSMRNEMLFVLSIVKVLVVIIGLGLTFWILIKGLMKKEPNWQNKAMKYFFLTWFIIIILSIIEF
jgi:uncharacterized membrane protein